MTPQKTVKQKTRTKGHRFSAAAEKEGKDGILYIVPLGGLEEVGRNMMYFEYGNDIIIVDAGLGFPGAEEMPGIDYIIPNIKSLEEKKNKIRGLFITHGHYDHIGAMPYIMEKLGNPPVYATPLTRGMIVRRQDDFKGLKPLKVIELKKNGNGENNKENQIIKAGVFEVEPFHVNHNIPDSVGFAIKTPVGKVIHTGDFKFDFAPLGDYPADISKIVQAAEGGVTLLISDSTNALEEGHVQSEKLIMEHLDEIVKKAPARIIAATFASLIVRIQELIAIAEKYGRKVVIDGYSMRINTEVAQQLGYIHAKKGTLIQPQNADDYPPEKIMIICTGAQGEDKAVLMRIINGEHKYFKIKENDTVIFSSSVIPGNERSVQYLKDNLAFQRARIFHYQMMDIHASGHAYIEDLKLMLNLVRPKFFLPVHGHFYMRAAHAEIAAQTGVPYENIILPKNGQIVELTPNKIRLNGKVPSNFVFVDGLGVGDVGEVVIRDRQMLAKDGMFTIIVLVDGQTGQVKKSPDIISRGFIYLKESKELLKEIRDLIRKIVEESTRSSGAYAINTEYITNNLRDEVGKFLFYKTHRRPMILPVVLEV